LEKEKQKDRTGGREKRRKQKKGLVIACVKHGITSHRKSFWVLGEVLNSYAASLGECLCVLKIEPLTV
jgi:hypothetical protein